MIKKKTMKFLQMVIVLRNWHAFELYLQSTLLTLKQSYIRIFYVGRRELTEMQTNPL